MTHIVRIDKTHTHGWQVRGSGKRKYHSRLFSDRKYGGPDQARQAAKEYLAELPPDRPPRRGNVPFHCGQLLSSNSSGINGVSRSHSYHGQTGERQEYWAAFCPQGRMVGGI